MARRKLEEMKVKGFCKVLLKDAKTGRIVGYRASNNVITQVGFSDFIVKRISASLTGVTISHGALATQTASPSSTQTSLIGEIANTRKAVTGALNSIATLDNYWSYATNEATGSSISAIGLFNSSSGGSLFSVALVTASTKTTEQTLAITYQVRFS